MDVTATRAQLQKALLKYKKKDELDLGQPDLRWTKNIDQETAEEVEEEETEEAEEAAVD